MRWWLKVLIPIVAIGVIAAATYAELVLDIRAPRSNLTVFARLTGSSSFLISDVNRRSKELKSTIRPWRPNLDCSRGRIDHPHRWQGRTQRDHER